jgi:hypothetical protein
LQYGDDNVEPWRRVFREGIAPQLPLAALEALRHGLLKHDPRLRPGATVDVGWTPGGTIMQACAIGYAGWKGLQLTTPAEIWMFFEDVCSRANQVLGDPGACGAFINWFDGHRREFVFPPLLTEVNRAIAIAAAQAGACEESHPDHTSSVTAYGEEYPEERPEGQAEDRH